tara:strand:- start:350 stop:580 length:231 start_codon:yes stop_codon:yes gene_type:complete
VNEVFLTNRRNKMVTMELKKCEFLGPKWVLNVVVEPEKSITGEKAYWFYGQYKTLAAAHYAVSNIDIKDNINVILK